jgi:hypothetical protein
LISVLFASGGDLDGDFVGVLEQRHALFGDVRVEHNFVVVLARGGEADFFRLGLRGLLASTFSPFTVSFFAGAAFSATGAVFFSSAII